MQSVSVACLLGGAALWISGCGSSTMSGECDVPWSYKDFGAWNALPGMCGHADDQSPIDIVSEHVTEDPGLQDVVFNMFARSVDANLTYDMKTWLVNVPPGAASVTFQGKEFHTTQFHFHSPSEHTIDGVHGLMEVHFVNQAADNQVLAVAMILDIGAENAILTELEHSAAPNLGDNSPVTMPNPYHFTLGMDQSYYHYTGSVTTPPCTNDTEWVILRHRPTLSPRQLAVFRHHMNDPACNMLAVQDWYYPEGIPHSEWDLSLGVNNRPTMTLGNRTVHSHAYSAPSSELAAGAPEPSDVLMVQQLGNGEHPRRLWVVLSCLSLFSAATGAIFLRRQARAEQDKPLPSHFIEISD